MDVYPNLRLKPLSMGHLPHIMKWVNDPAVMQYFATHQKKITKKQELEYLRGLLASPNDFVFSIFDGDKYVGQCSLNAVYRPAKNARAFLVIQKDHQHKGYGRQALFKLLEVAFQQMGLHKVWLIVRKDNRDSQAMYLKLGFEFEGVLKDEYCVSGKFFDMVRMAMINPAEKA